ncbi:MAG: hypothetical protein KGJ13_09080 [Patescibacteria group bacterium]|nr:hypothetical protein [Patescibacteria group bacterium]
MTFSVNSPADMVNLALRRIGYAPRVGNLFDGSRAANAALDIYGQTRDGLLRAGTWGFAERNVSLTLLKQAPALPGGGHGYTPGLPWSNTYPPLPWLYEYTYPADCLEVRAVKPVPFFVPNFDPQPHVFSVENDSGYSPPQKVILCNVESAACVYTGRITDPTTWEVDFVEALADQLGQSLAPLLKDLNVTQLAAKEFALDSAVAAQHQG